MSGNLTKFDNEMIPYQFSIKFKKVYQWIIVNILLAKRSRETRLLLTTLFGNSNARYHQISSKLFHIGLVFGYQYLFMNNGKYFTKKLKENV